MKTLNLIRIAVVGITLFLCQQSAIADSRYHRHEEARESQRWQKHSEPRHSESRRHDYRYDGPEPYYKPYYQPGYAVKPLPRGYSRLLVNAAEYFYYDGFFYRPSRNGYVVVDSPIGAVIANLPRLHRIMHWRGQPYFVAGNTFYRRHAQGYVVVPDPGFGYRR